MSIFKKGKEKFNQAMSAAAFAEAGEFETARQLAGKNKNLHKKVLVVLEGHDFNKRILTYAENLCQRLGGQLEILHKRNPGQSDTCQCKTWEEFAKKNGDVACISLAYDQSLDEKLIEYGNKRRDILCVVLRIDLMDNKPNKKKDVKSKSPNWVMKKLNCPVMVYS